MSLIYSVYGFFLESDAAIPGLTPLLAMPRRDVKVWFGKMPNQLHEMLIDPKLRYVNPQSDGRGKPVLTVWELADGSFYRFLYADDTEFILDQKGREVWAAWPEAMTPEDTATYLLGPVLGFLLRLRGITCLHASAIAVGDRAIALFGLPGAGKSTTAASFAMNGYRVLSDDVAPLHCQDKEFLVQPGYPLLRLWPDSVSNLFGSSDALPLLTPNWDKRYLDLTERGNSFQPEPLPLSAIYVLGERSDDPKAPYVKPLPARSGMMTLVANTYTNYLLDEAMRAEEFKVLGRLMGSVPLRQVTPHTDPSNLDKLRDVILEDYRRLAPKK